MIVVVTVALVFYLLGKNLRLNIYPKHISKFMEAWDPHTGNVIIPEKQKNSQSGIMLKLAPYHSVFLISEHKR